ncbi:hypothetical protein DYU11_05355 [Fibrisoma montanum]|uniref:Histidine kinase n=1 Tax=Fibrisoma montanum TaxID=2305895 RepID=A0A418MJR8_9BACT|nr:histidine kinase [Fibrisoma montanum]RIV27728.1 hypothetical protein DYU11_05355 [Fibrisoma montanum]
MRWCLFFGLLLSALTVCGQPLLLLPGKLPQQQMDIGPYTMFYEDPSGDTLPLSIIRTRPFRPFAQKRNERVSFNDRSVMVTWLRFTLRNSHPSDTLFALHLTGVHGFITLYENDHLIGQTGISFRHQNRPSPYALPLTVPPLTEQIYFVRVLGYVWHPTPISSELITASAGIAWHFGPGGAAEDMLLAGMALLTGWLLLMSLYAFYFFLIARDIAYLFYALYTGVSVLFSVYSMNYRFSFYLNWLFPPQVSDLLGPFHVALISAFYVLFIAHLLAIRNGFPRIWRILQILLVILVIQEVHSIAEWVYGRPLFLNNAVYIYAMVPSGLATGILLVATFRSQSAIRPYLATGMISLLGISFIPGSLDLYFYNVSALVDAFFNYPQFWILLGLAIESFCFMLALAYRGRLIEVENRRIQERYAYDLETQLAERTHEIETQNRLLEAQHIKKLEAEFEQKLAETEMTALRAQMNPHFIFNCLNSIKLYTLENDADRASEYLTKFSRLIRIVLENSRSERVTLHNELDMLRLYADMETMRFKQKLSFFVEVEPGVDADFIEIPPLLLQPYVENAIWHGLMHKPEGGTVRVRASQLQENLLQLTITDDGVGRARAAELKSKSANHRKSFGLKMTSERIALVNQLYQTHTQVEIQDLVDTDGQPAGTEVIIQIPI